jgi:gamma-glutamyltranspeptidase
MQGPDALYTGEIATKIVEAAHSRGGIITNDDLAKYKAIVREPISISEHNAHCNTHDLLTETL